MIELIKNVALKMMDENTPQQNLIYVVALLLFFIVIIRIDRITEDKLDFLFSVIKVILGVLTLMSILGLISSTFFRKEKIEPKSSNVAPKELIGLYRGSVQPLNSTNTDLIAVNLEECRLDIGKNLNCILYSENDTTEQLLGKIFTISDPVSSILIPKLGWAICEKNGSWIKLHNDSLKNKNYYFNFNKNEDK